MKKIAPGQPIKSLNYQFKSTPASESTFIWAGISFEKTSLTKDTKAKDADAVVNKLERSFLGSRFESSSRNK